jgi:pilus assembly protein CpaB
MRILLLISTALVVAGGTGFYVMQGLDQPPPVVQQQVVAQKSKDVFVPTVALSLGTIIQPGQLGRMPIAESSVTAEMVVADEAGEALLTGSVARQALAPGVPIARSAIVQPGDRGFLAAVLPKGKRAISIPISEISGISGLVLPGDRVDIILTYSVSGNVIDAERDIRASETVETNLRVLALDQRMNSEAKIPNKDGDLVTPPIAKTATLEVTPEQAELITLATQLGELSLVLNSVRDGGEPETRDDALPRTEAVAMAKRNSKTREELVALRSRPLTLDSDVTSLLQRESTAAEDAPATAGAPGSPVPLQDRTTRVQVVRGPRAGAVQLGAMAAPAGATEAAPAEPAAEAAPTAPVVD